MVGSIFRLVQMKCDNNDGIWDIHLTLCSDDDHQLQSLFRHMKNQLDDTEKYFRRYLQQRTDSNLDLSSSYFALGRVTYSKGDYETSLNWHNKALEIYIQALNSNNPIVAGIYNTIAAVYYAKGDNIRALESYKKALWIFMEEGEDLPDVGVCLYNMGRIYRAANNYTDALECQQKALVIHQKYLPADHPHLVASYNNIGATYESLNELDQSLEYLNLSLEIAENSLLSQHPVIAITLENIGLIYEKKK